jgi:large subunit ribosomal protein L2
MTSASQKKLTWSKKQRAGRGASGRITVRHQGGGHKRRVRDVDFKRDKTGISGKVSSIEYDPNRGADVALIVYRDGEKRYILAADGMKIDDEIIASPEAELERGNRLPLEKIPIGMQIYNLELRPGKGGQVVRGAGTSISIMIKEENFAQVKFPSGEIRKIPLKCWATIGQVSNPEHKQRKLGKAGAKRWLGIRPSVRGVAQHPGSHPHGGGEGRSGIGMPSPKSPWGKKTLGKKTRKKKKYSDKWIVKRRK